MPKIQILRSREILDSRGNPTVEVEIHLDNGIFSRAAVPSGASTGSHEAVELRDHEEKRYDGKGVLWAVDNVNSIISQEIIGMDVLEGVAIDQRLIGLDGTDNKSKLGANAILGVSLAVARAAALCVDLPLYQYIHEYLFDKASMRIPTPMFNIMNGGVHADDNIDFQEFMIVPVGASNCREAIRMASETYHSLGRMLKGRNLGTGVGDEGGFAPRVRGNREAIELILEAIEKTGFKAGEDIAIALDPAASEFFDNGIYCFNKSDQSKKTSEEMIEGYREWLRQYPICSIEDGLAEQDWRGWKLLTQALGSRVQLVGDDIFVTNTKIIQKAISEKVGNATLIKPNQIGTLSETLEAIRVSQAAGYEIVISHRSGETWDDFISDLAVATGAGQMKSGAPCRGERVAKYNQLMRIEEELGEKAAFAGREPFQKVIK